MRSSRLPFPTGLGRWLLLLWTCGPSPLSWAQEPRASEIAGVVRDARDRTPVPGAQVLLLSGAPGATTTDDEGRFFLPCAPGTVRIRVLADLYRPRRVQGILVEPGQRTQIVVSLEPDPSAVMEFVVSAQADLRTEEALLQARMRSASVADAVSAEEMARAPDSAASDAVKRVVATTLVEGRFAAIRGLGGRYTSVTLNRIPLPSPDPDEISFPIDLLPASLLSNLSVAKTHTAEMPGNFGGGALVLGTNTFPQQREVKVKAGMAFSSESVFRDLPTYPGGRTDFLGYDDGSRDLPDRVPGDRPVTPDHLEDDDARLEAIGESFRNEWETSRRRAWPNLDLSFSVGDTVGLGATRLGYLVSASYAHRDFLRRGFSTRVALEDTGEGTRIRDRTQFLAGTENARIGALVDLGLRIDDQNELELLSLYIHDADKSAQYSWGYDETNALDFDASRLQFVGRTLSFTQLRGLHRFRRARNLEWHWSGDLALVLRQEPDTRDIKHVLLEDGRRRFDQGPGSAERRFTDLKDLTMGGRTELILPLPSVRLALGGGVQHSSRDLDSRRFRFLFQGKDPGVLFLPIEEMLSTDRIGPDFRVEEKTTNADSYDASLLVGSAWASAEVLATDPVRITPGLRMEYARQRLDPFSPFSVVDYQEPGVRRSDLSFVPSLNLAWAILPEMNLRAAYGWTLARPQFRELAPFAYYDSIRRRTISGNPSLETTRIHAADLRWEWFPTALQGVVAASVFFKYFDDPIERVILAASQGDVGYENAPSAWIAGGELEFRASLGFLWRGLREFRFQANAAVIQSRVRFRQDQATLQTSRSRPLQGQSPFVVNLGIGWTGRKTGTDVNLLYNAFGRRITEVGFDRLPDVYEEPVHRLDLTVSQSLGRGFRLRMALSNLAYQPVTARQGTVTVYRYQPGITGGLSVEWAPPPGASARTVTEPGVTSPQEGEGP